MADDLIEAAKKEFEEKQEPTQEFYNQFVPSGTPEEQESAPPEEDEPESLEDKGVYCCTDERFFWYDEITLRNNKYYCPNNHVVAEIKNKKESGTQ